MGVVCAPNIFQSIMMDLLGDFDSVLVYIDNILIIQQEGETVADHLHKDEINGLDANSKERQASQAVLWNAQFLQRPMAQALSHTCFPQQNMIECLIGTTKYLFTLGITEWRGTSDHSTLVSPLK